MFQKIHQIIVGRRKEFDKDLSNNTDTWFLLVRNRKRVEIVNDLPAKLFEAASGRVAFGDKFPADKSPFLIESIGRAFFGFIRTDTIQTSHKDVTEQCRIDTAQRQHRCNLKSWILFQSA